MDTVPRVPSPPPLGRTPEWAPAVVLTAVCAVFIVHALHHRFLQDDAFIFFRYAENWATGWGPVWNHGEWVEGYTSPAWLALLTVIRALTGSFVPWIHGVSIGLGVLTLIVVSKLASAIAANRWAGVAAAFLLATDRTFALWSASGMETRLFGFAVITTAWLVHRRSAGPRPNLESAMLGPSLLLLCLTRPEGFLFAAGFLFYLFATDRRHLLARPSACGLLIWMVGIAAHLGWRWMTYGDLLPNTFYAKVGGLAPGAGMKYLADFSVSFPVIAGAAALAVIDQLVSALRARRLTFGAALAGLSVAYVAAIVLIGGGFMEFRLLDPVGALIAVLITTTVWTRLSPLSPRIAPAAAVGLVFVVAAVNLNQGMMFEDRPHEVMTRTEMWEGSTREWILVGRFFASIALPGESLATTAAGAIPYYAGIPCLDMLGLNDRFIAHLPVAEGAGVGHVKRAPESYLVRRRITYVLGHPRLYSTPKPEYLRPDEFLIRITAAGQPAVYIAVRTTLDRTAVITSLRARGVEVVDPPSSIRNHPVSVENPDQS